MAYPRIPEFQKLTEQIHLLAQLKAEHGAGGIAPILAEAEQSLRLTARKLRRLSPDPKCTQREPSQLPAIQAVRPRGPRRIWQRLDRSVYRERLEGALLGRMAGCTLGAPVEFWPIEKMEALAEETGSEFPPTDYWSYVPDPASLRYKMSRRDAYTRDIMDGVPVDDDIAYTLMGLLIAEEFGPGFTTEDVGAAWLKYLPYACTAEEVALNNLRDGCPAALAAERGNPFQEWIGADIRADPWAYLAPGWPEQAAALAHRDAMISHRRQGIYGEMFFAAAISAAFAVDDPVEALLIGLTEIPRSCALASAIRWALRTAPDIRDYRDARKAVDRKFKGMSPVHTLNNACLTVWGITLGGTDLTRVIGETVAMGLDNDCTAATAGSLVGAVIGERNIPARWHRNFNNTVHSYLIGKRKFTISELLHRFAREAARIGAADD